MKSVMGLQYSITLTYKSRGKIKTKSLDRVIPIVILTNIDSEDRASIIAKQFEYDIKKVFFNSPETINSSLTPL